MSNEYRNNHYVPVWYQKRFLDSEQADKKLFYLDLKPETIVVSENISYTKNAMCRKGPKSCFCERDLYTISLGSDVSTDIEKKFFGTIDVNGKKAIDYFSNFSHPSVNEGAFQNMVLFMSSQKLRTPKGIDWISERVEGVDDHQVVMSHMISLRDLHSAIWTEGIWQIASASQSKTKFIISDHPVTVYNKECGPRNRRWCRGSNDPDIALHGTHTIFPLSPDKVLIITNSSWVKDPYQSAIKYRPNPAPFRQAIFKVMQTQTHRELNEQEVREINFIIKSRAFRYVAATNKEWLYPEETISKSNWNLFGNGYLLMPDPRPVNHGGELIIGHRDGSSTSFDQHGRRPWDPQYGNKSKRRVGYDPLYRFKGEFAQLFGPYRRGRSFSMANMDPEKDSDETHKYHLSLAKKKR